MKEKEARAIFESCPYQEDCDVLSCWRSEGYLEAIEKAKVFTDLEEGFKSCKRYKSGDGVCVACADLFFQALAKWNKEA